MLSQNAARRSGSIHYENSLVVTQAQEHMYKRNQYRAERQMLRGIHSHHQRRQHMFSAKEIPLEQQKNLDSNSQLLDKSSTQALAVMHMNPRTRILRNGMPAQNISQKALTGRGSTKNVTRNLRISHHTTGGGFSGRRVTTPTQNPYQPELIDTIKLGGPQSSNSQFSSSIQSRSKASNLIQKQLKTGPFELKPVSTENMQIINQQ